MGMFRVGAVTWVEPGRRRVTVLGAATSAGTRHAAIVLTEVNPSYDPSGDSLDRYIEAVTGALVSGLDEADQ